MDGAAQRPGRKARGFSLLSGGLDSQLAICVLREAGAEVEALVFATPFFTPDAARRAADALGVPLSVCDFTADIVDIIKHPPHGFGSAMNPCIDCHAAMIRRAGEMMRERGWDFVATGEVLNQRPMSQNRQSLGVVAKSSGLAGRLLRPLCAQLLEPTVPELEGLIDRSKLLAFSGRRRDPQFALAERFGVRDFPSPAGGCKLTEKGFGNRLRDLMEHEGLDDLRLVKLLAIARRFRLPGGAGVILGRDAAENKALQEAFAPGFAILEPATMVGPAALVPGAASESDIRAAAGIVAAWSGRMRDGCGDRPPAVRVRTADGTSEIAFPSRPERGEYLGFQIL